MRSHSLLPLLASVISYATAQTFTNCNPLEKTNCPLDTALGIANYSIDFNSEKMSSGVWKTTAGTINQDDSGAQFVINKKGDSPTVQTNFYLFFGQVEVIMRAASGQGIISSIVLESDDLDEVDWEFMGGNTSFVETNYFGKGNTTAYDRAFYYPVDNPMENFHNYTTQWTSDAIDWYIDGNLVRTLAYGDANGGQNFPQTPMNVRLGIWAGGDSDEPPGVIAWAGGKTDYSQGPYTMTVQSVRVSDFGRGTQYKYGDTSGSFESIQTLDTAPPLQLDGNNSGDSSNPSSTSSTTNPTSSSTSTSTSSSPSSTSTSSSLTQSAETTWSHLSHPAKIATIAGSSAGLALVLAAIAWCCIRRRRSRRAARLSQEMAYEKQRRNDRDAADQAMYWSADPNANPDALASTPGEMDRAMAAQYPSHQGGYTTEQSQPLMPSGIGSNAADGRSQTSFRDASGGSYHDAQSVRSFTGGGHDTGYYGAGGDVPPVPGRVTSPGGGGHGYGDGGGYNRF